MPSLQPSATPVTEEGYRRAVAEALEELRAARKLIASQDVEIGVLTELNRLEREVSDKLKGLRAMDGDEIKELRLALDAAQRAMSTLEAQNALLKKNQWSTWKWIKAAAVGAAAGIVIGAIAVNR